MTAVPDLEHLLTHSEWLKRLARQLVADGSTADDLVQETWMAALRQPPDPGRPAQPWLSTVVRRLAALRSRREAVRSRELHASTIGVEEATHDAVARVELERGLADQVLALEEPYRSAILLRYYRGMSATQIARESGVPSATVRTRLMRGLDQLRARLDRKNGGDGRSWLLALGPLCTNASAPTIGAALIGAGFLKLLVGIALLGTVLVVAWRRTDVPNSLDATAANTSPQEEVVKNLATDPPTVERSTESSARVAIASEGAVSPAASSNETTLIVRAVRRDDGQPVPEVTGFLTPAGSRGGYSIRWPEGERRARLLENANADSDGILRFDLPHGEPFVLYLRATVQNVGTLERPITPMLDGEQREFLAEMPVGPDVHFMGRVLDDATGEPLGAIEVTIPQGYSSDGVVVIERYATTMTDSDGYFAIDGLSWERQHLEIDAPGYGRLLAVLVAGHDSREKSQELRLQRSATLDVHVVGRGGAPLAVEVRATTGFGALIRPQTGVGDTTGFNPTWSVTTNSDGRAAMAGLPPGVPIKLELWRDGQLARRVAEAPQLSAGETRILELSLGNGARILGQARRVSGEPIASLEVWLRTAPSETRDRYFSVGDGAVAEQRVVTGAQGQFGFEDVPPGSWLVGPSAHYGAFDAGQAPPIARFLRIAKDATEARVDLDIEPALAIRGVVVDAAGVPRAGVWVRLDTESLDGSQSVYSGEDGRFVAAPLAIGRFRLVAYGRDNDADSEPIWATAGTEEEVRLTLGAAAQIHGRVVDDRSGAGRAAEIRLISADESSGYVRWNKSSREGDFRLESLQQGTYHLQARSDDGGIALLRNLVIKGSASLEGLEVRLRPGAIVVFSDPQATKDRCVSLEHDGLHAGHGYVGPAQVTEQVLHPGRTTVILDGGAAALELDLIAGERREVTLPGSTLKDR